MCEYMYVGVSVRTCVYDVCNYVCVKLHTGNRYKLKLCVCGSKRERERERVCVCVCV